MDTTRITFLSASTRLAKEFTLEGQRNYPLVKNFTSHQVDIPLTNEGILLFTERMRSHADAGDCLYKGNLRNPITNESRAGKTDTQARTRMLVIDVDGFNPGEDGLPPLPWGTEQVEYMAKKVVSRLPSEFSDVTYVAQASASLGVKNRTHMSMHLFFFLDEPVLPGQLKLWLTELNLDEPTFREQLSLTATGMQLHYPIDRCMADNSRIIYIAPPTIATMLTDPFEGNNQARITTVMGRQPIVRLSKTIAAVNAQSINERIQDCVAELREARGLKKKKLKTTVQRVGSSETTEVISNPDRATVDLAYVKEPFAYLNLNGGDSNGYYFFLDNPRWVRNFKGEPMFELEKVDPDFFRWAIDHFREYLSREEGVRPLVFRDFDTDSYFTVEYDVHTNDVVRSAVASRQALDDFMVERFEAMPDPIETWSVLFDPAKDGVAGLNWDEKKFNLFTPTSYMGINEIEGVYGDTEYGQALERLRQCAPNITNLIMHAAGDGQVEFEHYINWLAYVFQYRVKTSVAWVFQGVEGTGKGILFNQVLKPLFGERYAIMKSLENLEDQFDSWREYNLMTVVDEFKMSDTRSMSRMYNKLKNMISEPQGTVRYMRSNPKQVPLFSNHMFFTNDEDSFRISDTDRRFNIAPRQEHKLNAVYVPRKMVRGIKEELDKFAAFLNTFNTDPEMAMTALANDAKIAMRRASSSWIDDFAHCFNTGCMDVLIDAILMAPRATEANMIVSMEANRALMVKFIREAVRGDKSVVSEADILRLYLAAGGFKDSSVQNVSKTMLRRTVNIDLLPRELRTANAKRGIVIQWHSEVYDLAEILQEQTAPVNHKNLTEA